MTHVLLQNSSADILLIQEPWYNTVSIAHSDKDPKGIPVLGPVINNLWTVYLPAHSPSDICKVAIYVKSHLSHLVFNQLSVPYTTPCFMAIDIILPQESIRLINVYHCVPENGHGLHALINSDIDDTIPTLIFGDFNTHSLMWSLPGATLSPWASPLEIWFANQGLSILNPPNVPTWRGRNNQKPSIIDLALCNDAVLFSDQVFPILISFDDSLGSDHAAMTTSWIPSHTLPTPEETEMVGFSIVDEFKDSWSKGFSKLPTPQITDITS